MNDTKIDVEGLRAKVKPLEWTAGDGITADKAYFTAESVCGTYWVIEGQWGIQGDPAANPDDQFFNTDEEAKSAAQSDYATRILSAVPALLDRIADLEGALRPFAKMEVGSIAVVGDENNPPIYYKINVSGGFQPGFSHFRDARTTLSGTQHDQPHRKPSPSRPQCWQGGGEGAVGGNRKAGRND